jgi:lipid-A-disaccharide synthase
MINSRPYPLLLGARRAPLRKERGLSIFWLVGEKSGDLHSAKVMERLNRDMPNIEHTGIGGALMQQNGLQTLLPFERFQIMGFLEVLKHIPFILRAESVIKRYLKKNKPDLVILVDYPGLNLRIAKIAHDLQLKVLYFICPQFWAWKHHRIHLLKKYCSHVACIFPFEKTKLDEYGIKSTYVGHPVTEAISFKLDKNEFAKQFDLDPNKKWISFFPGSRDVEISKLLPVYIETIKKLKVLKPDYQFLISKSYAVSLKLFMSHFINQQDIHIIDGYNYEMMKYSDFLIVKSGTTTIEAASIETPFVIVYKVNKLSYLLAKKLVKIKYIGLPNIVFDDSIVPELIQDDFNPDKIIETMLSYMDNEEKYKDITGRLADLHTKLGDGSASGGVAEIVVRIV